MLELARWLACGISDNPILCVNGHPIELAHWVPVGIVMLTVGLTIVQTRREGHVLFQNCGVSFVTIGIIAALPPILIQAVWEAVRRV